MKTVKLNGNFTTPSFGSHLRRRVSIDCSEPVLTDQSWKQSSDINNIMAQYMKTGLLPETQGRIGQYIDNTLMVPLEVAHKRLTEAKELFYELPAQVRRLMDNDPTRLDSFLTDPDNYDILVKHEIIIPRPQKNSKVEPVAPADPPAVAPSETKPKA